MSYEREAAHTVLLMVTRDWWMALERISSTKIKKVLLFLTLISFHTYISFFHVWNRQLDVLKNVQALFHIQ